MWKSLKPQKVVEEATVETPQEEVIEEQREVVQSKEENAEFTQECGEKPKPKPRN